MTIEQWSANGKRMWVRPPAVKDHCHFEKGGSHTRKPRQIVMGGIERESMSTDVFISPVQARGSVYPF